MDRGEMLVREAHRMDLVFVMVTAIVWAALAAWGIYAIIEGGIGGAGIAFIVFIIAVIGWIKLAQMWIQERRKLLEGVGRESLDEEIRKLREAIEKLRSSLEG